MARRDATTVRVGEYTLEVSNLDKVLYPSTGTTKGDVMRYYLGVAPVLIPQLAWRPVTRKRWVNGVGTESDEGKAFFRKDLEDGAPAWIPTGTIAHSERDNTYPLANHAAVLAWFAQLAALELHVPQWRFGADGAARNPDRLVIDLDPGPGTGMEQCVEVARATREILDGMGLGCVPVTSGSKGIHLYAPLDGKATSKQVSAVVKRIAEELQSDLPELVVSTQKKTERQGKVLVDWSQNSGSKTTICPYSLRGRAQPTAACPRTWEELDDPTLAQLRFEEVLERVDSRLDPLASQGWAFDQAPGSGDQLTRYREKRDARRTPEPVPVEGDGIEANDEPIFVIQEHHASRLHWDFRLERDGVLVSWAVPKGPPLESGVNRLAVQTEDHPISYATFEGTIPKGEYGGGAVTIWDAGTFTLEKWRDKEVIATLTGRETGGLGGVPRRFVLIRTRGEGEKSQWLLQLMKEQPEDSSTPSDADPVPVLRHDADPIPALRHDADPVPALRHDADPIPELVEGSVVGASTQDPLVEGSVDDASTQDPLVEGSVGGASTQDPPVEGSEGPTEAELPAIEDLPAPMLATHGDEMDIDDGQEWSLELKWDGVRVICAVNPSGIRLVSRSGKDMTGRYPELAELSELLRGDAAILDGEIVALDDNGRPNFPRMQPRMTAKVTEAARMRDEIPVTLMVFDILQLSVDGQEHRLMRTPYRLRRQLLVKALEESERIRIPPAFDGDLAAARSHVVASGLEGVVAKRCASVYTPGARSSSWIKIKQRPHQAVVVVGWRTGEEGSGLRSLLMGIHEDGELRYVGRVGSGIPARDLKKLEARLATIERKTPPVDVPDEDARDARWVTPKWVGEVAYAERTPAGRLRQPSWRGFRPDIQPADVVWEG